MGSREVPKLIPNVFELASVIVEDLNVACEIPLPINLAELVEGFVRDVGNVELMITCTVSLFITLRNVDSTNQWSEGHNPGFRKSCCLWRHLASMHPTAHCHHEDPLISVSGFARETGLFGYRRVTLFFHIDQRKGESDELVISAFGRSFLLGVNLSHTFPGC